MGVYFGTDGFRGRFAETITPEIAFRCGNALGRVAVDVLKVSKQKVIVGRDTRESGDVLMSAFSAGAMSAGADVVFVGMCPTACVSFLTKQQGFDFGVMISASHNPAEYNGIKIFKSNGQKIGDEIENLIEKNLLKIEIKNQDLGKFVYDTELVNEYQMFLENAAKKELAENKTFCGLKIVLDCANGTASFVAGRVFENLGATVILLSCEPDGKNINKNCGALHVQNLQKSVIQNKADFGFAFDGDSDRVISVDENGDVVDGDQMIYVFANFYKKQKRLDSNTVVATKHTNMGIEKALFENGIKLIRTDVGDKYVSEEMENGGYIVGGEQSGHVFLKDKLETGDGVLNALILTAICVSENQKLSTLSKVQKYHQKNTNIEVKNKDLIMQDEQLRNEIEKAQNKLCDGRVMVRASGTEPKIRIMTESQNEEVADFVANELEKMIRKIDMRGGLCVE